MISQTAEYALRAIVHLADHAGRTETTDQIAAATLVPVGYLAKILQGLTRAGLVHSQRGLGGGFTLVGSADELTLYDVVQAVDPILRIRSCPLNLRSHGLNLCPLHRALDDSMAVVEANFRATTIRSLINDKEGSHPLCEGLPAPEPRPSRRPTAMAQPTTAVAQQAVTPPPAHD